MVIGEGGGLLETLSARTQARVALSTVIAWFAQCKMHHNHKIILWICRYDTGKKVQYLINNFILTTC